MGTPRVPLGMQQQQLAALGVGRVRGRARLRSPRDPGAGRWLLWGSRLQTGFVGCRVSRGVRYGGAGRKGLPLAQGLTAGCNFISRRFALSSSFFQLSWKTGRWEVGGVFGKHRSWCQVWWAEPPPRRFPLCPQPRVVEGCSLPPFCPGWGLICMTISGAWRGGLGLGFPGHIPAAPAFPSKWAPSRCRVPCQSNSLLWNRETKSPPSYFGGVREGVGTPLIQPCSLLTCLFVSPPPGPPSSG